MMHFMDSSLLPCLSSIDRFIHQIAAKEHTLAPGVCLPHYWYYHKVTTIWYPWILMLAWSWWHGELPHVTPVSPSRYPVPWHDAMPRQTSLNMKQHLSLPLSNEFST